MSYGYLCYTLIGTVDDLLLLKEWLSKLRAPEQDWMNSNEKVTIEQCLHAFTRYFLLMSNDCEN